MYFLINFLRKMSQGNRVIYVASMLVVILLIVAGLSSWQLTELASVTSATHSAMSERANLIAWIVGVLAGIGSLIGFIGAWLVRLSIKAPVEDTVKAMMGIAAGDLLTKIDSPGRDDLSWLRHELNSMRKKIHSTLSKVTASIDSTVDASENIAAGNTDLSARTESQAEALEETTEAMKQMAETVRLNADHAHTANDEMKCAREVATRSGEIMQSFVQSMEGINQSANRIHEIVSLIDDIAFQTNLLALNAAVEAARAGEHGRGFAVVATEVRALSERSSTAAREIKALIGDSTEKMEVGMRLVGDANQTMEELLQRVAQVSDLSAGLANAAAEQSQGIEEVQRAVAHIDEMTQENSTLVEEIAVVALFLKDQSNQLSAAMDFFQVNHDTSADSIPPDTLVQPEGNSHEKQAA